MPKRLGTSSADDIQGQKIDVPAQKRKKNVLFLPLCYIQALSELYDAYWH